MRNVGFAIVGGENGLGNRSQPKGKMLRSSIFCVATDLQRWDTGPLSQLCTVLLYSTSGESALVKFAKPLPQLLGSPGPINH